jgi:hypothetical protein
MPSLEVLLAFALVFAGFLWRASQIGKRDKALPPGPPTVPLLGNLAQIPPRYAHLYFDKVAKQYGSIFSLKLFGGTMVVLNDGAGVVELLDKRSASFNERSPAHVRAPHWQGAVLISCRCTRRTRTQCFVTDV